MDSALTTWINAISGHWSLVDAVMVFCAEWGVPIIIGATVALWWLGQDRLAARHACIIAAIAFVASLALNQVILLFIHRLRPYEVGLTHLLIPPNPDWSFPSDHATAVASIAAAFWVRGVRWPLWGLLPLSVLICISRVYVGVHYATDILGGIGVGTSVASLVNHYYRPDARLFRWLTALL